MNQFIWGDLQKSLDDNETIEQAIARVVAEHEADPAAHQGEGESLQNHKNNEIIDHPAGSVKIDKFSVFQSDYNSQFSDFDNWYKTESDIPWQFDPDYLQIFSELGSANDYASIAGFPFVLLRFLSTLRSFMLSSSFSLDASSASTFKFRFGLGGSSHPDVPVVGFEIRASRLWIVYYNFVSPHAPVYVDTGLNISVSEIVFNLAISYDKTLDTMSWFLNGQLCYSLQNFSTSAYYNEDSTIYYSASVTSAQYARSVVISPRLLVDFTF